MSISKISAALAAVALLFLISLPGTADAAQRPGLASSKDVSTDVSGARRHYRRHHQRYYGYGPYWRMSWGPWWNPYNGGSSGNYPTNGWWW